MQWLICQLFSTQWNPCSVFRFCFHFIQISLSNSKYVEREYNQMCSIWRQQDIIPVTHGGQREHAAAAAISARGAAMRAAQFAALATFILEVVIREQLHTAALVAAPSNASLIHSFFSLNAFIFIHSFLATGFWHSPLIVTFTQISVFTWFFF